MNKHLRVLFVVLVSIVSVGAFAQDNPDQNLSPFGTQATQDQTNPVYPTSGTGQGQESPSTQPRCDPATDLNCTPSSTTSPTPAPLSPADWGNVEPPTPLPHVPAGATKPALQPGVSATGSMPIPPQLTEFQRFAAESVGVTLPIFGRSFFRGVPSTFAPVNEGVAVNPDYVIGPGDVLFLQLWGQVNFARRVPVDQSGSIFIPKVGSIPVAGTRYGELPDKLKTSIGQVFKNFDLAVNLASLRTIRVLVVGQAEHPGTYTISSLSTLVNAIFTSGGPSQQGSMRRIQLRRSGSAPLEFDLYDLLLHGDKWKDVFLHNEDVIYFPPIGAQVAVSGSINVPGIYELNGPTTLEQQLGAAGGLSSVADGHKVTIERIEDRAQRHVIEIGLTAQGMQTELRDADIIHVFPIVPRFDNAITLRGNIAQPGRYQWHEGMRVRDLIPNKEFLLTRRFWLNQNLLGRSTPPTPTTPTTQQKVTTEVLENEIKRSAPEINWDYAVIQRVRPQDLTTSLLPFNLGKVVIEHDDAENLPLQPGDIVTIFSQRDLSVPTGKVTKFIRLEGEFKTPGVYQALPGESLRDIAIRVGGFTDKAYLFGAQLTRESARIEQQQSLDILVRGMERDIQQGVAAGAGTEDAATLSAQAQYQRLLVERFRQIKPVGRIVLEVKPTANSPDMLPPISLEDGDLLYVPQRPNIVTVVGSVQSSNSFLFRNASQVHDYLNLAGRGTRNADVKNAFVIRADGSVVSRQNTSSWWSGGLMSTRALPGDVVVVPSKLARGAWVRALRDWTQLGSQLAITAASIAVIGK